MLNGNDQIYKSERREIKIFVISAPTKYTFALYIIRKTYHSNSAPVEHTTHYTTVFPWRVANTMVKRKKDNQDSGRYNTTT